MKVIVCHFNLFDRNQRLTLVDENGSHCLTYFENTDNVADISKLVMHACSEYETNKVHLFGPLDYITKMRSDIKKCENTLYNKNELEIEVN